MARTVEALRHGRGLGIFAGCWLVGEAIRNGLGLVVPGGIIGLGALLILLWTRTVPLEWVEDAAATLLKWLPLLLLPAFVLATRDRTFLKEHGVPFVTLMSFTLLMLWAFVGWLAQLLFRRFPARSHEPGPLTDAEEQAKAEREELS